MFSYPTTLFLLLLAYVKLDWQIRIKRNNILQRHITECLELADMQHHNTDKQNDGQILTWTSNLSTCPCLFYMTTTKGTSMLWQWVGTCTSSLLSPSTTCDRTSLPFWPRGPTAINWQANKLSNKIRVNLHGTRTYKMTNKAHNTHSFTHSLKKIKH